LSGVFFTDGVAGFDVGMRRVKNSCCEEDNKKREMRGGFVHGVFGDWLAKIKRAYYGTPLRHEMHACSTWYAVIASKAKQSLSEKEIASSPPAPRNDM
jgi:hypothetical protein